MSSKTHRALVKKVLMAGRENGTRGLLFQQTVGQILGLSATDMKCLDLVACSGSAHPTELSQLTGLTTGAVTVLIDRLERAGLIERRSDPTDRRMTVLAPTAKALRTVPPLYESMGRSMSALASQYSDKELLLLESFFSETSAVFVSETKRLKEFHLKK